jgi:DcmR-like sensory protein
VTNTVYSPYMPGDVWSSFLAGHEPHGHAAQVYADPSELAQSVSAYLAIGFELGEPAVVVATPEHLSVFMAALAEAGWDKARIDQAGLLAVADAAENLGAIMDGGDTPSKRVFEEVVGGLLDRFPGRHVRAFGEMVDLLSREGRNAAAIALENLWNDVGRRRDFSLLCGYHLNVFDRAAQAGVLPDVCRTHSHILPSLDPARLTRAVDQALEEVLGAAEAGKVYVLVGQELRSDRIPMAQVLLMWVSTNMPALAERVLASARARYEAVPAASPG